jgi:hypothetical protein
VLDDRDVATVECGCRSAQPSPAGAVGPGVDDARGGRVVVRRTHPDDGRAAVGEVVGQRLVERGEAATGRRMRTEKAVLPSHSLALRSVAGAG